VLAFERHREDDDMTELPRNDLDHQGRNHFAPKIAS
jgi:hypothetical protein